MNGQPAGDRCLHSSPLPLAPPAPPAAPYAAPAPPGVPAPPVAPYTAQLMRNCKGNPPSRAQRPLMTKTGPGAPVCLPGPCRNWAAALVDLDAGLAQFVLSCPLGLGSLRLKSWLAAGPRRTLGLPRRATHPCRPTPPTPRATGAETARLRRTSAESRDH